MSNHGWIGVDLDGTVALYEGWVSIYHIGAPIAPMIARIKKWLARGQEVRIFTARVSGSDLEAEIARSIIQAWCIKHIGQALEVTNQKDFQMACLWDDRAIPVAFNQGFVRTLHADHDS